MFNGSTVSGSAGVYVRMDHGQDNDFRWGLISTSRHPLEKRKKNYIILNEWINSFAGISTDSKSGLSCKLCR